MFRTALALILLSSPVFAAELNKATLFTKDGLHVNQTGFRNVAEYYGEAFKAGFNKLDAAVDQVHPLTADTGIAMGTFTTPARIRTASR